MSAVQQMLLGTGGGDPYYANVSLLLHMDGSNGGTTFTDNSSNAYTPTLLGSTTPTTSTAQIKFGTASGYFFSSSASGLQYPIATPLDIYSSSSTFTLETWVYPLSNNNRSIIGSWEGNFSGDRYLLCLVGGVLYINWDGGTLMSGGSVPNNTWTYIALVRNGNVFTAYINGVSVATTTYSVAPTRGWWYTQIGVYATNNWPFDGYMDELRITKGIARYTANFTPPTAAFPNS